MEVIVSSRISALPLVSDVKTELVLHHASSMVPSSSHSLPHPYRPPLSFSSPLLAPSILTPLFLGIRLNSNSNLLYVSMQNFRAGLVWNSNGGHSISEHIHSTNNYYGTSSSYSCPLPPSLSFISLFSFPLAGTNATTGLYVQRSNGDNYIGLSGLEVLLLLHFISFSFIHFVSHLTNHCFCSLLFSCIYFFFFTGEYYG